MNAPNYIEANYDLLRYRTYSLGLHQSRLEEIKNRGPKIRALGKSSTERKTLPNYAAIHRQYEIRLENNSLQNRIERIKQRKMLSVGSHNTPKMTSIRSLGSIAR
jgi:hypothetical protein